MAKPPSIIKHRRNDGNVQGISDQSCLPTQTWPPKASGRSVVWYLRVHRRISVSRVNILSHLLTQKHPLRIRRPFLRLQRQQDPGYIRRREGDRERGEGRRRVLAQIGDACTRERRGNRRALTGRRNQAAVNTTQPPEAMRTNDATRPTLWPPRLQATWR